MSKSRRSESGSKVEAVSKPDSIDVGDKYFVSWKSGQKCPAEVIAKRLIDGSADDDVNSEHSINGYEYYVHYVNFDRRLDEWVSIDRFDFRSVVESSSKEAHRHKKTKRKLDDDKESVVVSIEKEHEEITKVKNIQAIQLGRFEVATWYFSPYPEEYCNEKKLYVCEYCLKYMKRKSTLENHSVTCEMHGPPGVEIYRKGNIAMFEVDGRDHKIYCQNLCLLSKLFLDHKTLYYDVDPFLFYVLCEVDDLNGTDRFHIVGYFSKEKQSQENYNLACILTFPCYQRMGYGKFLISVSYELTKRECTTGSPEKPLSDLGKISYRSYWTFVIMQYVSGNIPNTSLQSIARATGIKTEDILSTLHALNLIKCWKGQHVMNISEEVVNTYTSAAGSKDKPNFCDAEYLSWQPPDKSSASTKK